MDKKYLILVAGKMRTGKNTFAEMFQRECDIKGYSVKLDAFAAVLKEICSKEFIVLTDYLNHFAEEVKANVPIYDDVRFDTVKRKINKVVNKIHTKDENWFEDKNDITRLILQVVGTNLFRKYVDDNFWIKEFLKKLKDYSEKFVIVTDVRFPNEIDLPQKLVEDRTVISVKMERVTKEKSNHLSETALDTYDWFDYTVQNDGDLELLRQSVHTIIKDIEKL